MLIFLIGLIVASPFGIFFSGEDSGTGQTMPTIVQEINLEYESKLEEIESNVAHDRLELSGSRAVWPEVLAVYAVKTTTDPDNPQEVATMDDGKKELLKEIFWAMNEISHRTETATTTQTVETDDGKGNIMVEEVEVTATTLYITVTHKTADEMADIYNFTADQREMLAELLAEESNGMWSAVLYGIGTGDGEIVTVALSQLGNVGRSALLVLVWLREPGGLVRLLCFLVRQRVRLSGRRRHPKVRKLLHRYPVVPGERAVAGPRL